jgi:hypothetical protein
MLISGRELSEANGDRTVGEKVIEAYDAIHALGVIYATFVSRISSSHQKEGFG